MRSFRHVLPVLLALGLGACTSPRPASVPPEVVSTTVTPAPVPTASTPPTIAAPAAADTTLVPADLAGTWQYTLETPAGSSSGYYVFRADGAALTGEARRTAPGDASEAPRPMQNVALDGAGISFTYAAGNYGMLAVALRRTAPDRLAGRLYVGDSDLPITAVRLR